MTDPIDNMSDFLLLRENPSNLYFHFTNQVQTNNKYHNLITTFSES